MRSSDYVAKGTQAGIPNIRQNKAPPIIAASHVFKRESKSPTVCGLGATIGGYLASPLLDRQSFPEASSFCPSFSLQSGSKKGPTRGHGWAMCSK